MKKFYLLLTLIVITAIQVANAQAPQGIPYQAVARDNAGNLIKNQPISLRFSIHDGSASGAVVYSETHAVTTDALGLFSVNIGGGTSSATLADVNWGSGAKFTQVELDVAGGSNYIDMGTTQMMSVPYALYAGSSAAAPSVFQTTAADPNNISNVNSGNVGIGTDAPTEKLDVVGNAKVSGKLSANGGIASGTYSTALGYGTIANGYASTATGIYTKTYSEATTAMGGETIASASCATAMGQKSNANGVVSTAMGFSTTASGYFTTAMGNRTTSKSFAETSIGTNNTDYTPNSTYSYDAADRLFVIGNGADENNKSDAMVVLKNGNTTINGEVTANSIKIPNGTNTEFLMADGTTSVGPDLTGYATAASLDDLANNVAMNYATNSSLNNLADNVAMNYATTSSLNNLADNVAMNYATNSSLNNLADNVAMNYATNSSLNNLADNVAMNYATNSSLNNLADNVAMNYASNVALASTNTQVQTNTTDIAALQNQISNVQSNFVTTTMGSIGSSPSANGGTITSGVLNLTPADANNGGVVTTGDQTFAGNKTFVSDLNVNGITIGTRGGNLGNTVIGGNALANNSTGYWNNAIGANALSSNSTGNYNVADGLNALLSNTTGETNTAIGVNTLESNTTGSGNIAIGTSSLQASNANYNIALGSAALFSNTSGTQNVASGSSSIFQNTTGNNNTANGFQALYSNVSGSNNTALGYTADVATGDLSNATAIGSGAIVNASNKIQLGNTNVTSVNTRGTYTGAGFVKDGGTSSQYLMADGSTSAGTAATTMGTIGASSTANGGTISSGVLSLAPADGTNGGIVTSSAQTFGGKKTFLDSAVAIGFRATDSIITKGFRATANNISVNAINVGRGAGTNVYNTSMGYLALDSNTTGGVNTAMGYKAMASNTTGGANTAMGTSALSNNVTSNNNSAFGRNALQQTTAAGNTAMGNNALVLNTTGADNTAVGNVSLYFNTTGSGITALGSNTGVASGNLTNATAIGYTAIVDASNKIQLGNTNVTSVNTSGTYTGAGFVKAGGTSSQYLMADGSTTTASTIASSIVAPVAMPTIQIGNQLWSKNNLDVSFYRNGDEIPYVDNATTWASLTTGAWCYYNNDPANGEKYGKLYNWYAVNDSRGLAPQGWHIPSDAEWTILSTKLGGNAGGKMKTAGTTNWATPNTGATNSSGFAGLPGGYREPSGTFGALGYTGDLYSSSESNATTAWVRYHNSDNGSLYSGNFNKNFGFSVRCLRD